MIKYGTPGSVSTPPRTLVHYSILLSFLTTQALQERMTLKTSSRSEIQKGESTEYSRMEILGTMMVKMVNY